MSAARPALAALAPAPPSWRGETLRIELTADNPGRWLFHCHNAYHLEAGMARDFQYVAE